MIYKYLLLFICFATLSTAQSIKFTETSLESAISMAKKQNKTIFVDTYASYCKPCKQMEVEFRNPELSNYFNKNFINVRVNMEGTYAEEYKIAYNIVFLPTLLFINPDGNVRMTIDHLVSARDLLNLGQHINGDPKSAYASSQKTTPSSTAPVEQPKQIARVPVQATDIDVDADEGKILYVMGQDGDLPPEILREEAYFRMELMDGSHHIAAKKYLNTQADWTTSENMQFIHDFLHDARSQEFEYLITNRIAFEKLIGKTRVSNTINILVNKELERAFPRPNDERVKELKSYL